MFFRVSRGDTGYCLDPLDRVDAGDDTGWRPRLLPGPCVKGVFSVLYHMEGPCFFHLSVPGGPMVVSEMDKLDDMHVSAHGAASAAEVGWGWVRG